eukprot:4338827-Prymnesium_polylepis.1
MEGQFQQQAGQLPTCCGLRLAVLRGLWAQLRAPLPPSSILLLHGCLHGSGKAASARGGQRRCPRTQRHQAAAPKPPPNPSEFAACGDSC